MLKLVDKHGYPIQAPIDMLFRYLLGDFNP